MRWQDVGLMGRSPKPQKGAEGGFRFEAEGICLTGAGL
jgi:hypothetical protein